jgi:hypothetical protein
VTTALVACAGSLVALYGVRRLAVLTRWVRWHVEPFASRRPASTFYVYGTQFPRYPRRTWHFDEQAPVPDSVLPAGATIVIQRARRHLERQGLDWSGRVQLQQRWRGAWIVAVLPRPESSAVPVSVLRFSRRRELMTG